MERHTIPNQYPYPTGGGYGRNRNASAETFSAGFRGVGSASPRRQDRDPREISMRSSTFERDRMGRSSFSNNINFKSNPEETDHEDKGQFLSEMDYRKRTHLIEMKFKERYSVLKKIYEERIQSLVEQVHTVHNDIEHDNVLEAMKGDPSTAHFMGERIQELVSESLDIEREQQFEKLAEDLSSKSAECLEYREQLRLATQRIKEDVQRDREQSQAEQVNEARIKEEFTQLIDSNDALANRLEELETYCRSLEIDREKEKDEMRSAVAKLKNILSHQLNEVSQAFSNDSFSWSGRKRDINSLEDLIEDLESSVQGHVQYARQKDSQYKELRGKQEAKAEAFKEKEYEMKDRLAEMRRQLQELQGENKSLKKELEQQISMQVKHENVQNNLSKSLENSQTLLSRSEKERLELRDQYLAIGKKLESLAASHEVQKTTALVQAENTIKSLKEKQSDMSERMKEKKQELYESEHRCKDLQNELDGLRRDISPSGVIGGKIVSLESKSQITEQECEKLREELRKLPIKQANEIETLRKEHSRQIEKLQDELRTMDKERSEERKRWEDERSQEVRESQNQIKVQYQKMLEEKEAALRDAERKADSELQRRHQEDSKVQEIVAMRMAELSKDHISKAQHRDILESQKSADKARAAQERSEMTQSHNEEIRNIQKNMERQEQMKIDATVASIRQNLLRAETEVEREKSERIDAERCLDEERRLLVKYRQRLEEEERSKRAIVDQLEHATHNIDRLKRIVTEQREKLRAQDTALAHERNKFQKYNDQVDSQLSNASRAGVELDEQRILVSKMNERIRNLQEKAKEYENRAISAERTIVDNEHKIATLETEVHHISSSKNEHMVLIEAKYKTEISDLQFRLEKETTQFATFKVEMERQIDRHLSDKVDLNANIEKLEKEKRLLEEDIKRLIIEKEDEDRKSSLKLNEKLEENRKLQETIKGLQESNYKLQDDISLKNVQHSRHEKLVKELNEKHKIYRSRAISAKKELLRKSGDNLRALKEDTRFLKSETKLELTSFWAHVERSMIDLSWHLKERNQVLNRRHVSKLNEKDKQLIKERENITQLKDNYHKQVVDGIESKLVQSQETVHVTESKLEKILTDHQRLMSDAESEKNRLREALKRVESERDKALEKVRVLDKSLKDERKKNEAQYELQIKLEKKLDQKREVALELEKSIEKRLSNFRSVLVAVSGQLALPKHLHDRLTDLNQEKFTVGLQELQDTLQDEVKAMQHKAQGETAKEIEVKYKKILKEKNDEHTKVLVRIEELSELRRKAEEELIKRDSDVSIIKNDLVQAKKRLQELKLESDKRANESKHMVQLTQSQAESKVGEANDHIEAIKKASNQEKQQLEKRFRQESEKLKEENLMNEERHKSQLAEREKYWSAQLHRERHKNLALRQDLQNITNEIREEKNKRESAERERKHALLDIEKLRNSDRSFMQQSDIHSVPSPWSSARSRRRSPVKDVETNDQSIEDLRKLLNKSEALDSAAQAFTSTLDNDYNIHIDPSESRPVRLDIGDLQLRMNGREGVVDMHVGDTSNVSIISSPSSRLSRRDL